MTDRIVSRVLRGSFTGTGQSDVLNVSDKGSLSLDFGSGTVVLERMGATGKWFACTDGTFTADASVNIEGRGQTYRLNCTSYSTEIFYELHAGA